MVYIPGCKYDVFISYAHFDNEADTQDIRWVSRFQADLKKALCQRLGVEPEIFFDTRALQAHHVLDELLPIVRDSAIFVPILSPSYVKREWTLRELEAFESTQSERNRIVTVELLPVKESDYPPRFLRLKRTQFWWSDEGEEDVPLKLTPKSNPDKYDRRLQTLAHQMEELLRGVLDDRPAAPNAGAEAGPAEAANRRAAALAATPSTASPLAGKVVLLAQVTNDLYDERDQVLAYLKQYGATVLPEGEYLLGGAEFASAVKADLEHADLFVQLLGPYRSNRPADLKDDGGGDPKSYAQFQYDAAKARGVPVLQWRRPDLDVATITHWDKPLLEGPQVLAMGLQEFMKEIKKTIERSAAAAAAAAARAQERPAPQDDFVCSSTPTRATRSWPTSLLKAFEHNTGLDGGRTAVRRLGRRHHQRPRRQSDRLRRALAGLRQCRRALGARATAPLQQARAAARRARAREDHPVRAARPQARHRRCRAASPRSIARTVSPETTCSAS